MEWTPLSTAEDLRESSGRFPRRGPAPGLSESGDKAWIWPRRNERVLSINPSRIGLVFLKAPVSLSLSLSFSSLSSTPETEVPVTTTTSFHPLVFPGPPAAGFALFPPYLPESSFTTADYLPPGAAQSTRTPSNPFLVPRRSSSSSS